MQLGERHAVNREIETGDDQARQIYFRPGELVLGPPSTPNNRLVGSFSTVSTPAIYPLKQR